MTHANNFVQTTAANHGAAAHRGKVVVAGSLIALLLTVGCSKENSKSAVATSTVPTASTQNIASPNAAPLSVAQPSSRLIPSTSGESRIRKNCYWRPANIKFDSPN